MFRELKCFGQNIDFKLSNLLFCLIFEGALPCILYTLRRKRTGPSADRQHVHEPSEVAGISRRRHFETETGVRGRVWCRVWTELIETDHISIELIRLNLVLWLKSKFYLHTKRERLHFYQIYILGNFSVKINLLFYCTIQWWFFFWFCMTYFYTEVRTRLCTVYKQNLFIGLRVSAHRHMTTRVDPIAGDLLIYL